VEAEAVGAAEVEEELDGFELGFVGAGGEVGGVFAPIGSGGVEVVEGGVDGGVEFGVDEEREAGAGDVWDGELEVGAVDGGEAVAAGVDEEGFEAGDAGEGEGFEVVLVAVNGAAPEGVVDHAFTGGGFALEFKGGDVGGFGEAVERHVDDGGKTAGGGGACGGGEAFPLGASGLVDVGVDVDEAGEQGEVAEVFYGDGGGQLGEGMDGGDVLAVDDHRGVTFALGRDDAAGMESVYHLLIRAKNRK
jgi:hypothetical protein